MTKDDSPMVWASTYQAGGWAGPAPGLGPPLSAGALVHSPVCTLSQQRAAAGWQVA